MPMPAYASDSQASAAWRPWGKATAGVLACLVVTLNGCGSPYASFPFSEAGGQVYVGSGTIEAINRDASAVRIRHQAIPSCWPEILIRPAFTTDFRVADRALLNRLEPGDSVHFRFSPSKSDDFLITAIGPT